MICLVNFVSKIECSNCGKIFYYPLLKSCFHCGRNVQNTNIFIFKYHNYYLSIFSFFIISMSYNLSIIREFLSILLFSILFLSLSTWNYYFKNKYRAYFVLPLKLRFYFLIPLIIMMLGTKLELLTFSFILFGCIFSTKFTNWMELSAKDLNSNKILNLTTIGDDIKKEIHFEKKIYKKSNMDISRSYYKFLWGIKRYSTIELITKLTIFNKSLIFYILVVSVGVILVIYDKMTFGLFSSLKYPHYVEWIFLLIIFTIDSIKSFSDAKKTDLKYKKTTALGIILKIVKKGSLVEYFYLLIFALISCWFFSISITGIFILKNVFISFNTYSDFDKILVLSIVFVFEFLCIYYIINLKSVIINFVTNNEKIPKYTAFLSTFTILLPFMYSIDDKEKILYFIISLLFVSIIIANNYIYRKYLKYELLPITKKTTVIFGVVGVIFIISLHIDFFLLFNLAMLVYVVKVIQIFYSDEKKPMKNLRKKYKYLWNYNFKMYIIFVTLLIIFVIGLIYNPPEGQYYVFYKILSIVLLILMLMFSTATVIIGIKSKKIGKKLIKDEIKRGLLIFRIMGMDGPFLKEREEF